MSHPSQSEPARRVVTAVLLALGLLSVSSTMAEELFRRAASLEEVVGRVELRRAYGARLQVIVECEEIPSGCQEERLYGDLIQLDFRLRTQEVRGDSVVGHDDPAGSIYLAADFDDADRESFLTELETVLIGLPASAFDLPFAGLGPTRPPFDKATLSPRSIHPTWVCYESHGRTRAGRFHRRHDGSTLLGIGAKHYDIPPTSVCEEIAAVTRSSYPDFYWTLSSPRRLLERVVEHEDAVVLDEDPRSLIDRPDGVQLIKQRMPNDGSLDSAAIDENGLSRATHGSNGWRFDAWAPPSAIPIAALDENAWMQALTIRSIEREFGASPSSRLIDETTTYAAFLPTVPAARLGETTPDGSYAISPTGRLEGEVLQPAPETAPRINRAGFLNQLLRDLDGHTGDPQDPIGRLLRRPVTGLLSEGWLVVVCNLDGSAMYYLPPTRAGNRVTNSELFCAALEARLN